MRQVSVKSRLARRLGGAAVALGMVGALAGQAWAAELELIEAGTLNVAFNGDMPGTGWQDGKLVGLDGELMQHIADQLLGQG